MRRTLEILTGLSGNSAVGRVTSLLPMGLDYLVANWWRSGGAAVTAANITEVRETLNADVTRLYSGTQQDLMNQFDGLTAMGAVMLRIPFELVRMKDVIATYSTTRNTLSADPDTGKAINQMKIDIVQNVATEWRLFAEVDDATTGGPGAISRILQFQDSPGGGAPYSLAGRIPFGLPERRFFRRGFFDVSAGNLNADFQIFRGAGNEQIAVRPKTLNDRIAGDYGVRFPAAYGGATSFVFDTTETGIPEMFDTMATIKRGADAELKEAIKNAPSDAVIMGGAIVRPGQVFDIRPQPSAAATLTSTIESVGRL